METRTSVPESEEKGEAKRGGMCTETGLFCKLKGSINSL
jgi:hypothetical protein